MPNQPDLTHLNTPLGQKITFEEKSYLYFGGTAYLGIPQNKAFLNLYLEGLRRFGLNNGTSRNNNVQLGIYDEVENYAAAKYGHEAALITSSGFLAAQIVVDFVRSRGEVRHAPATHPALWLNDAPQVFGSFSKWAEQIVSEINQSDQINWVLLSNSINNLYPERYDFSFLSQIKQDKQVLLVIDDSHGLGINYNGKGVSASLKLPQQIQTLVVASMAKAIGIDAGLVMGNKALIAALKDNPIFNGASPPSAAGLYAFMHGEKIYDSALNQLLTNTSFFAKELESDSNGWEFISDFPVFLSKNADLSSKLSEHNILISAFPYPDKDGIPINRIVLSSWHTKEHLKELTATLKLI